MSGGMAGPGGFAGGGMAGPSGFGAPMGPGMFAQDPNKKKKLNPLMFMSPLAMMMQNPKLGMSLMSPAFGIANLMGAFGHHGHNDGGM
jgi:hypothetical protein